MVTRRSAASLRGRTGNRDDDDDDEDRDTRHETRDTAQHDTGSAEHGHRRVHATLPRRVVTLTLIADGMRAIANRRTDRTIVRDRFSALLFLSFSPFSSSRVFISTAEISANRRAPSCFLAVASGTDRNGAMAGRRDG